MKKNFIINIIFLLFLNLLIKPFWIFGVERKVQNIVGTEDYGLYFSLFSFSLLLNIILDFGITNFNNRNIAQNPNSLSKYLSNILSLRILLGVIYTVLSLSIGLILDYNLRQMGILGILIFNQFVASFTLYLRSNISGLQMFKTDSIISVLDRFLAILFCSILVWGHLYGEKLYVEVFALCQTAAYVITCITALCIVLRKTTFFKFKFDYKFLLNFLRKSYPYAILTLLMSFYNRIDSVMLERLIENGEKQTGIYAQAFRINDAAAMFANLFAVLLLPMFAKMLKQKENVEGLVKFAYLLVIIPALFLSNICNFFNYDIMSLMYKENFNESAPLLGMLTIGFLGICTTYIFGTLLTANGNLKYLNIMALVAMILNLSLNFILIPKFQAKGAAISSMVTQLASGLSQLIIAKFVFNFKINYKLIIKLIAFVCLIFAIGYFVEKQNINWIYSIIIIAISTIILTFILKLFKIKDFFEIFKKQIMNQSGKTLFQS